MDGIAGSQIARSLGSAVSSNYEYLASVNSLYAEILGRISYKYVANIDASSAVQLQNAGFVVSLSCNSATLSNDLNVVLGSIALEVVLSINQDELNFVARVYNSVSILTK